MARTRAKADIRRVLEKALGHHKAGRFAEAERLYRSVLSLDAVNFDATHLLGLVLIARKDSERGIELLRQAIRIDANQAEAHNNLGIALKDRGELQSARACFERAIEIDPRHIAATINLALSARDLGRSDEAETILRALAVTHPRQATVRVQLGLLLSRIGKRSEAIDCFRAAIALDGHFVEGHIGLVAALKEEGRLDDALSCSQHAVRANPASAELHNNLGSALKDLGRLDDAIASYRRALEIRPASAGIHSNLGAALKEKGAVDAAIASYREAIRLSPDHAIAHSNLGVALRDQGRVEEAAEAYRAAIRANPNFAEAHNNLGALLKEQGRLAAAVECYERAAALRPDFASAHANLGVALKEQGRLAEACQSLERALALHPGSAENHVNLGNIEVEQGHLDKAVVSYRRALEIEPSLPAIWNNLGNALLQQGKQAESIECYRKALELKPDYVLSLGQIVHQLQVQCDWEKLPELQARLIAEVAARPDAIVDPFIFVSLPASAAVQRQIATRFAKRHGRIGQLDRTRANRARQARSRKLRIGYLSNDFYEHATSLLLAEALELHDRERFEIIAYSYGREDQGPMQARLRRACAAFHDIRALSFVAAAERIAADEIDILVDLKGYTKDARTPIMALRPSPVQVSWLGYPGTMGADFIDYIIADDFIIPEGFERFYAEKIVRLPDSYQPSDRKRAIGDAGTRAEHGLPPDSVVFCSFNQTFKIQPDIFAAWMRIITAVPGSVLWLLVNDATVTANLRREAARHGVAPDRLVFGAKKPSPEHLARYRLADLALDTFPCTSHTTGSDALWAGCPLVTLPGETFASRVAGSLLRAAGIPELFAASLADYEQMAIRLAHDPEALATLKARLGANRMSCALFDTPRFVKNLEAAYRQMWDIHAAGELPRHIRVAPSAHTSTALNRGVAAMSAGPAVDAPSSAEKLFGQGAEHKLRGRLAEAIACYRAALRLRPGWADALSNLGAALLELGDAEGAAKSCRDALQSDPKHVAALCNLGASLRAQKRIDDAAECFLRAVAMDPGLAETHCNLGVVNHDRGDLLAAISCFQRALAIKPEHAQANDCLGAVLREAGDPTRALEVYRRAIALAPADASLHRGLGRTQMELGLFADAVESMRAALSLSPNDPAAHANLGYALHARGKRLAAAAALREAVKLKIDTPYALGQLVHQLQYLCAWQESNRFLPELLERASAADEIVMPFVLLGLSDSPALQKRVAERHAHHISRFARPAVRAPGESERAADRIRIGYFSADLHEHATARLLAEVFELHDRRRFGVFAYSYGPEDGSLLRRRIRSACNGFRDVRALSWAETARKIASDEIDILVDLKGYTINSRSGFLAARPAPIQVNWLGYPGTMGAQFVDYIIADAFVVPKSLEQFYSEKIVRLPVYQPNDRKRLIGKVGSRSEHGLEGAEFVFGTFNQTYKISPEMFAGWMRILKAVPESVFWILADLPQAEANLRAAAESHGVSAARLVFARRKAPTEHLARLKLVDLFLDTFPCTSHTTASDALWVGCPVLTRAGATFASRVAGSLLYAANLPELVTHSQAEYEQRAIQLARQRDELATLRARLAEQRDVCALFDTPRFVTNLEEAYHRMWRRWRQGKPPANIDVSENVTQGPPDHSNGNFGSRASSSMRVGSTEDGLNHGEAGAKPPLGLASAPNESSSTIAPLRIDSAEEHLNRGVALKRDGDLEGAAKSYEAAIGIRPDYFEAHANLGNVLTQQGKLDAAITRYRAALTLNPSAALVHNNFANALRDRGLLAEAVQSYRGAIALEPADPLAHYNLGNVLQSMGKAGDAIGAYRRALELKPDIPFALGQLVFLLQSQCAWSEWGASRQLLLTALEANDEAANPFVMLGCCDDLKLQHRVAQRFGARLEQASGLGFHASWRSGRGHRERIRVGYLSADLHDHATSRLIAEVLELHDRTAFEIHAYSYGPDDGSGMRHRVRRACDAFHDVRDLSLVDAARAIDSEGIDILVDLKGYTKATRTQILTLRPAPIQVNWLGFPGTMGAPFVDYIVADAFIIPPSHEKFYSEKIVRLPSTYQPNDRQRTIGPALSRAECGLPAGGFVFCSFNQSFKILPEMFAAWMRILKAVPDSVLWLLERQVEPTRALRSEAEKHGVLSERLVFAASKPVEYHLARLRLADLALDTFPYTSHTTGSDALWAGCPLLTLVGESFASRVAGSLLSAAEVPELITTSLAEFEQRAIDLARRPEQLAKLKARLAAGRDRCALFDTPRFTRNLEAAYRKMFALWASGRPPENISFPLEIGAPARMTADIQLQRATPSAPVEPQRTSAEYYLNRGAALRAEGKLEDAKDVCEEAIKLRPDYAEAYANLGNVLADMGRRDEAIAAYRRALALKPDAARIHNNLGNALRRAGQLEDAAQCYRQALALDDRDATGHINLGNVLLEQGKVEEALVSCERALQIDAESPEAHFNRGNALGVLKRQDAAVASYDKAIALKPDFAKALCNRSVALHALARGAEALASADRALAIRGDYPEALNNRGAALCALNRWSEAAANFERLVALRPDHAEGHNHLGQVYAQLDRHQDALASLDRALSLRPDFPEALNKRGLCLQEFDRMDEALACFEAALAINPRLAEAHASRAGALFLMGRCDEAFAAYSEAQNLKPDSDVFHWNEAVARLSLGDFARGWQKYERRWKTPEYRNWQPGFSQPLWLGGEDVAGKTILLHAEQGLGDTIQFIRYAPLLAQRGARIIVQAPAPLLSLLASVNGVERIIARGRGLPPFDFHCPFASLPLAFGTRVETIPANVPYLAADDGKKARWAGRIGGSGLRVGLAWAGNPVHKSDRHRSIPFAALGPLLAAPGVNFFSVQKDLRSGDAELLGASPVAPLGAHFEDFGDAAAVVSLLDLVISVDTSVAHLAGALGVPVWIMIHSPGADFRWLQDCDDSPWYPTARLFRQIRPGDWDNVVERVREALARLVHGDEPAARPNLKAAYRWMSALWASGRPPENINVSPEAADVEPAKRGPNAALEQRRASPEYYLNRGAALRAEGKLVEAREACEEAIKLRPDYAEAYANLGNVLTEMGRRDDGIAAYRRALTLKPDAARIHNNLGNALRHAGQLEDAAQCYRKALALDESYVAGHINLGNVLLDQGRLDEAAASCERAIALDPESPEAHNNLGSALQSQGRAAEAEKALRSALRLKPSYPRACNNLGNALRHQEKFAEAVESYRRAIALDPNYANAYYNLGQTLKTAIGIETIGYFEKAVELDPSHQWALQEFVHQLQHLCDWDRWRRWWPVLLAQIEDGKKAFVPFPLLSQLVSAETQQRVAAGFARQIAGPSHRTVGRQANGADLGPRERLRIGYLSADFHQHPTSRLLAETLELHDRQRFEIVAYSYGPDDESRLRDRIKAACDSFNDISKLSFSAMSETIKSDRIDILVDLKGYTKDTRSQILADRPAPIQVNWLGYPGTMGAPFVDYIIADSFVIPPELERLYTEKVVRLPAAYQPNDRRREVAPAPTRKAAGLPPSSFVFCCFNQTYKILPDMFAAWMRILGAVADSVMWLLERSRESSDNLRRAATALGIAPERLVFAKHVPSAEHLARYRIADLALDTFPCTSHTTASDALWAGCPLLTLAGETFASRVAGSVLHAGGLPELVTATLDDYVRLATELATERKRLAALRARLSTNRASCALFDTPRFVANLERAYSAMWEAHEARRPPAPIDLSGST